MDNYESGFWEIIYMDANGVLTQRVIKVIDDEGQRVKAYCYSRHRIRHFKKSRILSQRSCNHQVKKRPV